VKKIVVIGTGRMGGAFATAFAKRTSHAVSIRGSHAGSSSAAALSRQLGVRVADDKELLAADQAPDRGVSAGGFPASSGATEKVALSSVTVCRGACLTIWARSSSTSGVKERNPS
jgi:3-hydroxyacyl-CoA dehydrogenase